MPCGRLSWLLVRFWAHVNIVVGIGWYWYRDGGMPESKVLIGQRQRCKCVILISIKVLYWVLCNIISLRAGDRAGYCFWWRLCVSIRAITETSDRILISVRMCYGEVTSNLDLWPRHLIANPDSSKTLALYKSFTYLLTYLPKVRRVCASIPMTSGL